MGTAMRGVRAVVPLLLFLVLDAQLGGVAHAAALNKPNHARAAKVTTVQRMTKQFDKMADKLVDAYEHRIEPTLNKLWSNSPRARALYKTMQSNNMRNHRIRTPRHFELIDAFAKPAMRKMWMKKLHPELEEESDSLYKVKADYESKFGNQGKSFGSAVLTDEEIKIKEQADSLQLKKKKQGGYKFILLCVIICFAFGVIAYVAENQYQKKLMAKWKDTYGTDCQPDTDFPDNPRWVCPKEMTFDVYSSGGDAANLALIPIMSGMASGLVFGFIDNAGLFFGMDQLDELLPKAMPKALGGTGLPDELVFAGMGNTFSDLIGAFLGTFAGRMVQISPSIEYDGNYPPIAEAFGVFFGCILGVLIPSIIVGDKQGKADKAAKKVAEKYIPTSEQNLLSEVTEKFDELNKLDTDKPHEVNVNLLMGSTDQVWDSRFVKADKIGSNDGYVTLEEIYQIMTLEYLQISCEGGVDPVEVLGDLVGQGEKCDEKAFSLVYG